MSRIDELIAELAPDGVAVKSLGEVGEFTRGNGLQKSDLVEAGMPAIHYGQIHTYYRTWTASTKSFVAPAFGEKLRRAKPGDLVIATTSEDDDAVAKATAWIGDGEVAVSGDAYIYRHSLDPRYVSYYFQAEQFQSQKMRHITGAKVRRISGDSLSKIRIPVPTLEVQQEIVRILDQFTQLEAELEARRCQYEHYRGSLLGFAADQPRSPIAELIHSVSSGRNKSRVEGGSYPVFGSTGPIGSTDHAVYFADAILVARVGANAGRVNAVSGEYDVSDNTLIVSPRDGWDLRFAFHQLTHMNLNQHAVGGGQPLITGRLLKRLEISVPPLSEQKRIALILDKFDALVNDISAGLPAELTARRKQYEHYRDKLLTFEEAAA